MLPLERKVLGTVASLFIPLIMFTRFIACWLLKVCNRCADTTVVRLLFVGVEITSQLPQGSEFRQPLDVLLVTFTYLTHYYAEHKKLDRRLIFSISPLLGDELLCSFRLNLSLLVYIASAEGLQKNV